MKRSYIGLVLAMSLLQTACSVFGIRSWEMPAYEVLQAEDSKEIRRYEPYVSAVTVTQGDYDQATNAGFRALFDYISGANAASEEIAMTAPVVQEPTSEEIAMTAPVLQEQTPDGWTMEFVLPSKYTFETAPQPTNPAVEIAQRPARTVAALRYSGFLTADKIERNSAELLEWLETTDYEPVSVPVSAGYDPPFTIPFLRRNEVLVEVAKK